MTTSSISLIKDPGARLDYTWDWAPWLADVDDTLSAATVLVPDGLSAVGSPVVDGAVVTQLIEGGIVDATFKMTCRITTVGGLIDERSIHLTIMDR